MNFRDEKIGLVPRVIRPTAKWVPINFRAVWEYREMLYFLAWRDIKVRYKQTALGIIWVVLQPLLMMAIYSIFFGHIVKVPTEGTPYPLFIFSGFLPWQLFANAVADCGNSLVANQNLITKVYFPRLVIPIAAVLTRLVDFVCAFFVLLGIIAYYDVGLIWAFWTFPIFVLLAVTASLGVGLWLSALNVKYRDVRHVVPFVMQVWFFACPVAYPSSLVPEGWNRLYALNPMVGVVEGFRWSLLGKGEVWTANFGMSLTVITFLLVGGLYFFRSMEKSFADIV